MAEEFGKSVEDGIKLSKRLYYGKDRAVAPPKPPVMVMEKQGGGYLPTSPMMYAVIPDPKIVDNPDLPSYQPHVHGRCDPPALIPLQMNRVELEVDSYLDTVVVRVSGSWRVHCVMGSRSCDCRVAIPLGEQGSILGVEVEIPRKLFQSEVIAMDDKKDLEKEAKPENGGFLTPHIFTFTIPKVDGGTNILVKVSWTQKLLYSNGEFQLTVPFSFPEYVAPAIKKWPKKEKIQFNMNSGSGTEIVCKTTSHPLKQLKREAGKSEFLYESDVLTWTDTDFSISYSVSSSHMFGGVILQSPLAHDVDQREMFCFYLFPGDQPNRKVFRKEIVFVIDISGSMDGKPLEGTKNALSGALAELDSKDSFNIIAFNGETYMFSSSMVFATKDKIEKAIEWMNLNFIPGGSTNISLPLNQAMEMVANAHGSLPLIFLVTDGAVEDERQICDLVNKNLAGERSVSPRIYTFGIGPYCNHHFLRMLAMMSRGQYDGAHDIDLVESCMEKLFNKGLSTSLANITIDAFDDLREVEVLPYRIPDLSEGPLIIPGRYHGDFPDKGVAAKGVFGDMSSFIMDLKVQKAKDIPFYKIFAKQQIDILTAQAWFSEDKQLEEKVTRISIQTGVISEYTRLTILENEKTIKAVELPKKAKVSNKTDSPNVDFQLGRRIVLQKLGIGFGNLTATAENVPPGAEETKLPEAAEIIIKAASNCCSNLCKQCCCMCCIQCCSKINDQCAIALTQLFTALACFGCLECCSLCCSSDGN